MSIFLFTIIFDYLKMQPIYLFLDVVFVLSDRLTLQIRFALNSLGSSGWIPLLLA